MELIQAIQKELSRLGVDCNSDPYSGISVRQAEDSVEGAVNLFDDQADGDYDGNALLKAIKDFDASQVTLNSDAPDNFWSQISDCAL